MPSYIEKQWFHFNPMTSGLMTHLEGASARGFLKIHISLPHLICLRRLTYSSSAQCTVYIMYIMHFTIYFFWLAIRHKCMVLLEDCSLFFLLFLKLYLHKSACDWNEVVIAMKSQNAFQKFYLIKPLCLRVLGHLISSNSLKCWTSRVSNPQCGPIVLCLEQYRLPITMCDVMFSFRSITAVYGAAFLSLSVASSRSRQHI